MKTISTANRPTELVRCALCKIDLRGRFVYIDDETETLLGRPREELFGRPILDVLDLNCHPVIDHLMSERDYYESHFDHAPLTLICNDGRPVRAQATMSLCFHGGNPVNFQLILKPDNISVRSCDDTRAGLSIEQFIERYLAIEPGGRIRSLAVLLQEFSGAKQVALYLTSDGTLEPRAGAGSDSESGFTFDAIPECTDLHRRVARSGGEYDVTDESAARALSDTGGAVPSEYVSTLSLEDGGHYLLRFIFSDNLADEVLAGGVKRARLARRMIERLSVRAPVPSGPEDPDIDVKFTVGFLSSLGIGACLVDPAGCIIGYNPALADLLGGVELGPTCWDFLSLLDPDNSTGLAALTARHGNREGDGDIRVHLRLPSGVECRLVIIRLAENEGDQSACWALMPQASAVRTPGEAGVERPPHRRAAQSHVKLRSAQPGQGSEDHGSGRDQ